MPGGTIQLRVHCAHSLPSLTNLRVSLVARGHWGHLAHASMPHASHKHILITRYPLPPLCHTDTVIDLVIILKTVVNWIFLHVDHLTKTRSFAVINAYLVVKKIAVCPSLKSALSLVDWNSAQSRNPTHDCRFF